MTSNNRAPVGPWLSQAEAAAYLSVSVRTIRHYIAQGHLNGYKARGSRLIKVSQRDLDALLRPVPSAQVGA